MYCTVVYIHVSGLYCNSNCTVHTYCAVQINIVLRLACSIAINIDNPAIWMLPSRSDQLPWVCSCPVDKQYSNEYNLVLSYCISCKGSGAAKGAFPLLEWARRRWPLPRRHHTRRGRVRGLLRARAPGLQDWLDVSTGARMATSKCIKHCALFIWKHGDSIRKITRE